MTYRENFDERAESWDDDPVRVARAAAVAEGIRSRVPLSSAMRALEYGCGTGLLSFELRHELGHITLALTEAIDVSPGNHRRSQLFSFLS
jgi:predicted TPR repeat methyltransferase